VSPAYYVCRPLSENDSKFLHYLLRSDIYIKQYERNSGGVRNNQWDLSYERFRKLEVILPDVQMQKKIAKYLDEKTALIDQIIEKKKKLIELLNEAVYSSSVVGMRGDVSDRNSLWQGEDASWLSKKAKWIFEEINIRNRPEEEMLAVTQDDGVVPKRLRQEQFVSSSSSEGLKLVGKNDFVISLRSFQGGIEYSMYKGLVSPAYTVIRLRKEYDTDFYRNYYKYLLKSPQFIGILNTVISGIRDGKNINFSDFKDIILPIPPTNSLNSMMALTKKVELLASYLKKQEKLFLEYKSSLISNVVTGKIKV
jgi:type I restriction enzyme S subunit